MKKNKWKLGLTSFMLATLITTPAKGMALLEGISVNQTTLVPLRTLSEALGVEIGYETDTTKITVQSEDMTTVMYPNVAVATVGDKQVTMTVAPQVVEGTTYVPLRFVGDALGATVEYKDGSITLGYKGDTQVFKLATVEKTMAPTASPFKKKSGTFAGKSVNYVTIDMNNPSLKVDIQTANDKVNAVNTLAQLANADDAEVSVNGTYFAAYNGDTPYPTGVIIKDGQAESLTDIGVLIGFTADNKVLIDRVNVRVQGYVNDQETWTSYRVNLPTQDSSATIIYTPMYGSEVPLRAGSTAIVCVDNKVVSIGTETTIPENGFILDAAKPELYSVGDTIRYETTYAPENTDASEWVNIQTALSAGPSLIIEGQRSGSPAEESFRDPKVLTQSGSRSFIGMTAKNELVVGVTSGTIDEMKNIAEAMNLTSAMCLDGGASSGLYYDGNYMRQPGRSINNALTFGIK